MFTIIAKTLHKVCNFIKKEALEQTFSWEFCKIFKDTFFTDDLRATACDVAVVPSVLTLKICTSTFSVLTLFTMGFFGLCSHRGLLKMPQSALYKPLPSESLKWKFSVNKTFFAEACILCLDCLPVFVFGLCNVMWRWRHFYDHPLEIMYIRHIIELVYRKSFEKLFTMVQFMYSQSFIVILETKKQ